MLQKRQTLDFQRIVEVKNLETDDENLLLIDTHFKPISGCFEKYVKQ